MKCIFILHSISYVRVCGLWLFNYLLVGICRSVWVCVVDMRPNYSASYGQGRIKILIPSCGILFIKFQHQQWNFGLLQTTMLSSLSQLFPYTHRVYEEAKTTYQSEECVVHKAQTVTSSPKDGGAKVNIYRFTFSLPTPVKILLSTSYTLITSHGNRMIRRPQSKKEK